VSLSDTLSLQGRHSPTNQRDCKAKNIPIITATLLASIPEFVRSELGDLALR
jgi:hypothetical protein